MVQPHLQGMLKPSYDIGLAYLCLFHLFPIFDFIPLQTSTSPKSFENCILFLPPRHILIMTSLISQGSLNLVESSMSLNDTNQCFPQRRDTWWHREPSASVYQRWSELPEVSHLEQAQLIKLINLMWYTSWNGSKWISESFLRLQIYDRSWALKQSFLFTFK